MKRRLLAAALLPLLLCAPAHAEEIRPEDKVSYDVTVEDWVATKSARVSLAVYASVSAATSGTARDEMTKAVAAIAKAEWKLTGFNRGQDNTGMERWTALFEARLPESSLGGLTEAAKKASKPGMQLSVAAIDFSPTLEEKESVRATLRTKIYKIAAEQLPQLNGTLPGRSFRISDIYFAPDENVVTDDVVPASSYMGGRAKRAMVMATSSMAEPVPEQESAPDLKKSEKIRMSARISFAAAPPAAAAAAAH